MGDFLKALVEILSAWLVQAEKEVAARLMEFSDRSYYAAGFWLFYCDYSEIHPPCLAVNSEEYYTSQLSGDNEYIRWTPPEWEEDVLPASDALFPLYSALSKSMDGSSDEDWEQLMDSHKAMMAEVCRTLTDRYHKKEGAFSDVTHHPEFVFGIFEERDGDEEYERLARLSIDERYRRGLKAPLW